MSDPDKPHDDVDRTELDYRHYSELYTVVDTLCEMPGINSDGAEEVQAELHRLPHPEKVSRLVVTVEEFTAFSETLTSFLDTDINEECYQQEVTKIEDNLAKLKADMTGLSGTELTLGAHNYRQFYNKLTALCEAPGVDQESADTILSHLDELPQPVDAEVPTVTVGEITALIEDLDGFLDDVAHAGGYQQEVAEIQEHLAQIEDTVPGFSPQVDPDGGEQSGDEGEEDGRPEDPDLVDAEETLEEMLVDRMRDDPEFFYEVAKRKGLIEKIDDNPELQAQLEERIEEIREEYDVE